MKKSIEKPKEKEMTGLMQRYIALLGGINVGGHRVKMTDLRGLFESLGYSNVATFIASGNVIFETGERDPALLQTQIEQHLKQSLGYAVPTFLRTAQELSAIDAYRPFPAIEINPELQTLSILFLKEALPDEKQQQLDTFQTDIDFFHLHQREIYWLTGKRTSDSIVDWKLLGKTIGLPPGTMRNATTVRKLAALVS